MVRLVVKPSLRGFRCRVEVVNGGAGRRLRSAGHVGDVQRPLAAAAAPARGPRRVAVGDGELLDLLAVQLRESR